MHSGTDIASQPFVILNTADETIDAIAAVCRRHHARAWLFGSQARGDAVRCSDIDVAVLSDCFDFVEEDIERIETTLRIDLVDLNVPHAKGIEHAWVELV